MNVAMRNTLEHIELEALTANTVKSFVWSERDDRTILVVSADDATNLTVKAGNGIQGTTDLVLTVPEGVSLIKLESGRFKFVSGENKGKVLVVSTGTPSVGIAALV